MPPAIIAAAIAGTAAVGGALVNKSATKSAAKAADAAAAANNALQRDQFNRTDAALSPYIQGGYPALNALQHYTGLSGTRRPAVDPKTAARSGGTPKQPGGSAGTSPLERPTGPVLPGVNGAGPWTDPGVTSGLKTGVRGGQPAAGYGSNVNNYTGDDVGLGHRGGPVAPASGAVPQALGAPATTGGEPDFAAYGAANPDLQAEWAHIQQTGNADAFGDDPNAYYAWHWQTHGQNEVGQPGSIRVAPPSIGGQPPPNGAGPDTGPNGPAYDDGDAYGPDIPDRASAERPTYGNAPEIRGFAGPDLSYDAFRKSSGYDFLFNEGTRGLNAAAGAAGGLQSGDAAKEAIRYGQNFGSTKYGEWEGQQLSAYNALRDQANTEQAMRLGQFNTDRSVQNQNFDIDTTRSDARYDTDLNYKTARFDSRVSDLFRLAGIGAGAASTLGGFGSSYAGAVGANNNSAADARGNAALAGAANTNGAIGNALNAYSYYMGNRGAPTTGGGGGGGASLTPTGGGSYGGALNPYRT